MPRCNALQNPYPLVIAKSLANLINESTVFFMLGFRILLSGLKNLFIHFFPAIGVSLLPGGCLYISLLAINVAGDYLFWNNFTMNLWFSSIGALFCVTVFLSWATINWHRVVILNERTAILPRFQDMVFFRYTWRAFILIFGLIGAQWAYFWAFRQLERQTPGGLALNPTLELILFIGSLFIFLVSSWAFVRFAVCLPLIAIGDQSSFRQAWRQTVGYTPAVLIIAIALPIIMAILSTIIEGVFGFDFGSWHFVIWFYIAMTVAVMTEFASYIRAQNDVTQVFE